MKRLQKLTIVMWASAVVLVSLFPPWTVHGIGSYEGKNMLEERTVEFRYLFARPEWSDSHIGSLARAEYDAVIRFDILAVELFVISAVAFSLFKLTGNHHGHPPRSEMESRGDAGRFGKCNKIAVAEWGLTGRHC